MQEKWIRLNGNSSSADILIYFYPFFHSLNPPTFSSHGGSVVLSSEDTTIARPCVWYTKSSSITLNCHKILISNQVIREYVVGFLQAVLRGSQIQGL